MTPFFPYRYLLLIPLFCCWGLQSLCAQTTRLVVYDSLPQLEERIHQAGEATLVINFWATWCKPCVEELPLFEQLNNKYAGQNVQVILVSLDFKSHIEKKVIPFLKAQKFQSEVILFSDQDANNWIPRIYELWDGAIPATIVIKGNKKGFKLGQFSDFPQLENFVRPFFLTDSTVISAQHLMGCCNNGK